MPVRTALALSVLLLAFPLGAVAASVDVPHVGVPQRGVVAPDRSGPQAQAKAQSFGLTAEQMLGAAAACEEINAERIAGAARQTPKSTGKSPEDLGDVQAAQQNMLDAGASAQNGVAGGNVDCNRVSQSFSALMRAELNEPDLQSRFDQPTAPSRQGLSSGQKSGE